jgi:hypothetical protein
MYIWYFCSVTSFVAPFQIVAVMQALDPPGTRRRGQGVRFAGANFGRSIAITASSIGDSAVCTRSSRAGRDFGLMDVLPSCFATHSIARTIKAPIFHFVAQFPPSRVIPVWLASAGVAAGGLQTAERMRTDPDVAPGRANDEQRDSLEDLSLGHATAARASLTA